MSESKPGVVSFSEEDKRKLEVVKRKNGHPQDRSLADVYKDENRGSFKMASIDFLYEEAAKIPEFTPEQIEIMNKYAKKSGRTVYENPFETMQGFHGTLFRLMHHKKIYEITPSVFTTFLSQIPEISETGAANLRELNTVAGNRFTYGNEVMSVHQIYQLLEHICELFYLDIHKPVSEILIDQRIKRDFPGFNYSDSIKMPLLEELDQKGMDGLVNFLQAMPDNFGEMLKIMIERDNSIILKRWDVFLSRNIDKIKFRKAFDGVVQPIQNPDYSQTEQWKNIKDFLMTGKSDTYGEADNNGKVDDEGIYRGLTYLVGEAKKRDDYTIIETKDSVELIPHSSKETTGTLH